MASKAFTHLLKILRVLASVAALLLLIIAIIYQDRTAFVLHQMAVMLPQILTGSMDASSFNGGFIINIAVSLSAMSIALVLGTLLGFLMTSEMAMVRTVCTLLMNLFRNSPWLVILYAMLYLLPFQVHIGGRELLFSPFLKATIGLSLPIIANLAEIVRGSIQTVSAGQWESARSLGYSSFQAFRIIILPQAIPRMIPNFMTTYSMLFIGSSLIIVTGTNDVLNVVKIIASSQGDEIVSALYILVLFLFFMYCYPIAICSRIYESRLRKDYS